MVVLPFTFTKLSIPDDQKGKGKSKRSATPGLWKEHFNEEEKKVLNEIMEEVLRKLGYNVN